MRIEEGRRETVDPRGEVEIWLDPVGNGHERVGPSSGIDCACTGTCSSGTRSRSNTGKNKWWIGIGIGVGVGIWVVVVISCSWACSKKGTREEISNSRRCIISSSTTPLS